MSGDNSRDNLRSAIKSPLPANSAAGDGKFEKDGRRVNFPADDSLVTGYLEPPNPWEKALNVTSEELVRVYKTSCEDHHVKPINKVIQQLQIFKTVGNRVESLSLKGEKLDARHYEALEEIFKRVQFHTIDVESTNLDDDTSVALFDMLEYYESASNLNISWNKNLSMRAWAACARMLKKTRCLESLEARGNPVSDHIMMVLCKTFRSGCTLTALHLENCNISGRSCTLLMMALKLNSTLRELHLADNKLSSLDALQIGNLLRSNSKLKYLDLRNNHVLDTGVGHIVDGLCDQSMGPSDGLQALILWSNQLTFCSAAYLCKAVSICKSLQTLNIGNNNITNEGVFQLRDALIKNRTLIHFGIQQAKITCEGAVALAEYIADNPCIQTIDLRENNIKVAGLMALSLSMKVNRSVTRLDLDKDPKKESNKDLQDQHQRLLIEIMELCENNHQTNLRSREAEEAEEAENAHSETEDTEQLSASVCRLLSIFEQMPKQKRPNSQNSNVFNGLCVRTDSKENSLPSSPTPVIVLSENDSPPFACASVSLTLTTPNATFPSPVNPGLLSPPAACPSPPKSRFRVSRVLLDSDTLLASAGSTPMPSPVPSPGHTPFPSPLCTPLPSPSCSPFPSPLSSPMGSPLSSPFRNGFANGMISYPNSVVISKVNPSKSSLVGDPIKKRALRPRSSSPVISTSGIPEHLPQVRSSRSLFTVTPAEPIASGYFAPPPSLTASDQGSTTSISDASPVAISDTVLSEVSSTTVAEVPPNTPDEKSDDTASWVDDASDLSELRMSCGSESWMDSLSDGLLSGGSSPTSESCPSLSSYSNITPLTSPTPNASISTVEDFRDPSEEGDGEGPSDDSSVNSCNSVPNLISPISDSSLLATGEAVWSVVSADSGVATPDSELSSASSLVSCSHENNSLPSDITSRLSLTVSPCSPPDVRASGFRAPPTSPMTSALLQFPKKGVASSNSLYSLTVTCKRALSPSASQTEFNDTSQSGMRSLELPNRETEMTSPTSPTKPIRKKKKREDCEDELLNSTNANSARDIKLAEPSCVRLFGGGVLVSPRQTKDSEFFASNTMTINKEKNELSGEDKEKCGEGNEQLNWRVNDESTETTHECDSITVDVDIRAQPGSDESPPTGSQYDLRPDFNQPEDTCPTTDGEQNDEGSDLERRQQIEDLKRSLEDAKVFISRRASTGSFPAGRLTNSRDSIFRRMSMTVDELIQKQLVEFHNNNLATDKEDKSEGISKCNEDDKKTDVEQSENGKIMTDVENQVEPPDDRSSDFNAPTDDVESKYYSPDEDETVCYNRDEVQDEYCSANEDETNFSVCRQSPEDKNNKVFSAIIQRDESKAEDELRLISPEGRPIAVAILHSEVKSPIRQRLIGSGTCGESSAAPLRSCIEEVVMNPQCHSIDPSNILHLFEDYDDGLPTIDATDILSRPGQESAAAETLKT